MAGQLGHRAGPNERSRELGSLFNYGKSTRCKNKIYIDYIVVKG